MRPVCLLICCILFTASMLSAQQDFEGTIIYSVKENGKPAGGLKVEFGRAGIRASFEGEKGVEKEELFILFDSMMVAEVNHFARTYRPRYFEDAPAEVSGPGTIAGYKTTKISLKKQPAMLGYFPGATFFVAEDLTFRIPPSMQGIDELIMVNNQKVVLGFLLVDDKKVAITNFDSAFNDPSFHGLIARATSVQPKKQDPSLFIIPADYSMPEEAPVTVTDDSTAEAIDSVVYNVDTTAAVWAEPVELVSVDSVAISKLPPPPPKKKKLPAKKSPAVKQKVVAPARKPGSK